ncbi:uncharacterized protein [Anoplolepis gracilipes]
MSLDLKKLKRKSPEVFERPKKKIDRFDGLSEEEVQKYTLEDYLDMNLDLVVVGINPSLMAAHRGRYYAGPGNHFYKLLHESGLTPRFVSFEEDYKLLQYSIGLTNIVTRATRSAAELKRTEIKEGAKVVEEKLKLYKPKVAVFNGKCIYEVFANIRGNKGPFYFGLQPECIDDTAIWVTPSSSARCANFPRMVDKLHFYTALKKYLHFLKGELTTNVDMKEFQFDGKCKQSVPSTSKMWRRKNISTFLHGGRVVNKNTLCLDTSEEDIAAIHTAEFLVEKANNKKYNENEDSCNEENGNQALLDKIAEDTEQNLKTMEKVVASGDVNGDGIMVDANKSNKEEASDVNRKENCNRVPNTILNRKNVARCKSNEKCTSLKIIHKTVETRNNLKNSNRSDSLDFMSIIKQKLSQKSSNNNTTSITSELKTS